MRRLLHEGTTLIVDRYAFSGVAYSAAKPVRNIFCWKVNSIHKLLQSNLIMSQVNYDCY